MLAENPGEGNSLQIGDAGRHSLAVVVKNTANVVLTAVYVDLRTAVLQL